MIDVNNLSKTYRSDFFLRPKPSLHQVSFKVFPNTVVGFIGANGAGKSTTLKILAGLLRPTSGEVSILGGSPKSSSVRSQIGYLPELPFLYDYLTGREFLELCGALYCMDKKTLQSSIERTQELLSIPTEWLSKKLGQYSKGMMQRVGLAQALLHQPKLLLLDEPLSGLDPLGRKQLRDSLLTLKKQGVTIFYSTHVLSDLESLCDRVVVLHQGRLLYEGTVANWAPVQGYQLRFNQPWLLKDLKQGVKLSDEGFLNCDTTELRDEYIQRSVSAGLKIVECIQIKPDFETVLANSLKDAV